MAIALDQLPPEILALLKQNEGERSRSVVRAPLTDLREPANPKDRLFRPQFHWSAEPDEEGKRPYKYRAYPKLVWNEAGEERVIRSKADEAALVGDWRETPPVLLPTNPVHDIESELASLTPEEREMVFEAHRAQRLARIQAKLGQLTDEQLTQVAGVGDAVAPSKRKPGRPKGSVTHGDSA